jgi:hypothetical protein
VVLRHYHISCELRGLLVQCPDMCAHA